MEVNPKCAFHVTSYLFDTSLTTQPKKLCEITLKQARWCSPTNLEDEAAAKATTAAAAAAR